MSEPFRYAAFISYSSKDAAFARRLHRALETYGIPSALGRIELPGANKKNRVYPVFRDREELSAGELGERIEAGLRASGTLIVVCSPNGAASPWVQKEIEFFVSLGRRDRIFAIISDTAPLLDEEEADATPHCFPPAFRGDALAGAGALEPLAADARRGKDGFRNAWLKLVAGLMGVAPGQLIDRDAQRQRSRFVRNMSVALIAVLGVTVAASTEDSWRPVVSDFFAPKSYYAIVFTGPVSGLSRSPIYDATGTPVLYNGIPVGTVDDLSLDANNPMSVVTLVRLDTPVSVCTDSRAELQVVGNPPRVIVALGHCGPGSVPLDRGRTRRAAPRLAGHIHPSVEAWRQSNVPLE